MERLVKQARSRQSVVTGTIDDHALNAVLNESQRDPVRHAMAPARRVDEEAYYDQHRYRRLHSRRETAPRPPLVDRRQARARVAEALQPPRRPPGSIDRPRAPVLALGAPLPPSVLARSQAWFGSMKEDLEQWDRLPCPPTAIDRTNYVLSQDGRGAALLALVLVVALITMLVRAFV
jgi:hypothetical protein